MLADRDLPYTRVPRIERFDADDLADLARLDKHASDDCDRRLLAVAVVLYPSVVRIAVLVAASGTAANARAAGVGACTTRTLLRFYPREDSQLLKASVRIRHLVPMSPLRQVMEEFHQHLGLAKQAHLTAVTESFGTADRVQYAVAAKAWQHAAGRTRAFLVELQKILQLDQVAPSQDEHDSVTCLLTDVEAGRHPMLDGTGDVSLPDAFNRRQTDRVRVCLPAVMITAEGELL